MRVIYVIFSDSDVQFHGSRGKPPLTEVLFAMTLVQKGHPLNHPYFIVIIDTSQQGSSGISFWGQAWHNT